MAILLSTVTSLHDRMYMYRDASDACRVVLTDHGAFVLINVYAPNAGPAPERPRAAYKCKFLQALHSKALQLRDAGRQVGNCSLSCISIMSYSIYNSITCSIISKCTQHIHWHRNPCSQRGSLG